MSSPTETKCSCQIQGICICWAIQYCNCELDCPCEDCEDMQIFYIVPKRKEDDNI